MSSRKQQNLPAVRIAPTLLSIAAEYARGAKFDEALVLLESENTLSSSLLAARILLRLGRVNDAIIRLSGSPGGSQLELAIKSVLLDASKARLAQNYVEIRQPSSGVQEARTLAAYFAGANAWRHGRLDEAKRFVAEVVAAKDKADQSLGYQLQAWIDVRQSRFEDAIRSFQIAIDCVEQSRVHDEWLLTSILHGAISTCVETLALENIEPLIGKVSALKPTRFTAERAAFATANASDALALIGRESDAYEMLLRARSVSPEYSPSRASVDIDISALMRRLGANPSSELHLDMAQKALFAISWGEADIDQRLVLVSYAATAAFSRQVAASRALTMAKSYTGKRNIARAFEHDGRAAAFYRYGCARLGLSRGDANAPDDMRRSIHEWYEMGYYLRAAIASLDLLEIEDDVPSAPLRKAIKMAPKSWLQSRRREIKTRAASPLNFLTDAERLVVEGICEGLTSREIAERAGKSVSTIRNQTISIYRRLDVTTRTSLVAMVKDAARE